MYDSKNNHHFWLKISIFRKILQESRIFDKLSQCLFKTGSFLSKTTIFIENPHFLSVNSSKINVFVNKIHSFLIKMRILVIFMDYNDWFKPRNVILAQKTLFTKNRLTTNYLTDKSVNGQFVGINFFSSYLMVNFWTDIPKLTNHWPLMRISSKNILWLHFP